MCLTVLTVGAHGLERDPMRSIVLEVPMFVLIFTAMRINIRYELVIHLLKLKTQLWCQSIIEFFYIVFLCRYRCFPECSWLMEHKGRYGGDGNSRNELWIERFCGLLGCGMRSTGML